MARVSPKQNRFSRGQISSKLHGSQDLELYYTALEFCRNYIVDGRGMLERKPGTRLFWRTKNDGPAVIMPFAYDQVQSYALEMGTAYMRAGYDGGLVLNGGVPFEAVTPYAVADLHEVSFHQMRDVMWIAHKNYALQAVRREEVDEFSIAPFPFRDGPYLDINLSKTSLRPSSRGSLAPFMTNNTSPSGVASDSTGSSDAYLVFDGDPGTTLELAGTSGWVMFEPPTPQAMDSYYLLAASNNETSGYMPFAWVIEGYDGSNYVTLDSRTGESEWGPGKRTVYSFSNETPYERYRFRWTASGGGGIVGTDRTVIAEVGFNVTGDSQSAFNLTASSAIGINNGGGFRASDVGRLIRVLGSDNIWRYVLIVSRTSSTVVTVRLYGPPLPDTARITRWRLGAIFQGNYPSVITFHENRLVVTVANRVFMTKPGDYDNMAPTEPDGRVLPDSAIVVDVPAYNSKRGAVSTVNIIKSNDYQLIVGTPAGIFTIQSNSFGEGITPDNVTIRPQEGRGAGRLEPEVVGTSLLFAHNTKKKLMGTYEKGGAGKLGAQDLSLPADDLAARGIKWMTYQEDPHGIIWVGLDDGSLAALTIQPEEKVQAWHEHRLGGFNLTNGIRTAPIVESGCTVPGEEGKRDVVHLVVRRTIGGVTRRFVEGIEPFRVIGSDIKDSFFLDGALKYSGNTDQTAKLTQIVGGGPLDERTFASTNCPAFVEGKVLSLHDGRRWHRGRITSVFGTNDITWQAVVPNALAGPADGSRWFYVDGEWEQLPAGASADIFQGTYEPMAQTANIWRWSIGVETLTGLSDYNGATIDLLVDGVPMMGQAVVGGQIAGIPEGTIIIAGFHEPTFAKLLSIEAGSQNGSAQGKQRPVYEVAIDILDSSGLEAGTGKPSSYEGVWEYFQPLKFPDGYGPIEGEPLPAHTGLVVDNRDENFDNENPAVAFRQVLPLPSYVRGIITRLSESDGK